MRASSRSTRLGTGLALALGLGIAGSLPGPAAAQVSDNKIRIGILGDPNADAHRPGDVVTARMAVEDFGGNVRGAPIEILSGNLLGGPDIGMGIARRWFDQGVDAIFSLGNSAVAIAVPGMAAERNRITLATSAGTDVLTNKACTAVSAHWTFDTYALPVALASGILADGGKDWFFLTIDYAFGHALQAQAARMVQAGGGRVVGNALHPQGTSDFSSDLTQARSSGANVLDLAISGAPLTSALKQFQEFGLAKTMRPTALLIDINDIHALGLEETQKLLWVSAFYWD